MSELRTAWRSLMTTLRVCGWTLATVALGVGAIRAGARLLVRWQSITGNEARCPRGHVTATVGVWQCSCGATFEGWAFRPCPVCRESAGWIPCATCGLPIRSPILP